MSDLQRLFTIRPAYDCIRVQPCVHGSKTCIPGTGGSHGVHNAELHMTVAGEDAEVTLVVSTGWDLPTVPARQRVGEFPKGAFVELHTAYPRYAGQEPRGATAQPGDSCYKWGGCYIDRGYNMADEPTRLLVAKGSDAVWAWLEKLYAETQVEMSEQAKVSQ